MLCKILIINMLDYKFKRFIFNKTINNEKCQFVNVPINRSFLFIGTFYELAYYLP